MNFNTTGEKWVDLKVMSDGLEHAVFTNDDGDLYVYADPIILNPGYCPECEMPQYQNRVQILKRGNRKAA